jgi:hypothetical protein
MYVYTIYINIYIYIYIFISGGMRAHFISGDEVVVVAPRGAGQAA